LGDLPGVQDVSYQADQMAICGDRAVIAHVGAALVRADYVPVDLFVQMPSLEDALVDLLERAAPGPAHDTTEPELIGAVR
jgi:hypothetical protein